MSGQTEEPYQGDGDGQGEEEGESASYLQFIGVVSRLRFFEGCTMDGGVRYGGRPLVVDHLEGFSEMPGAHSHGNDTHVTVNLSHDQWSYLTAGTEDVEILDHPNDDARTTDKGNGPSQGLFQFPPANGGLIHHDRFGVGQLVGQGTSLDHAQCHDLNEVAIYCIVGVGDLYSSFSWHRKPT